MLIFKKFKYIFLLSIVLIILFSGCNNSHQLNGLNKIEKENKMEETEDKFKKSKLYKVLVDDKIGYIDKSGEIVLEPQFEKGSSFSEGMAAIFDQHKGWGYIDTKGNYVIEPKFEMAYPFSEGLALVSKGLKMGYINKSGNFVIPPKLDFNIFPGIFKDGIAPVEKNGKWGYIDKAGKYVIEPKFDLAFNFSEGFAPVEKNGLWGYINKSGDFVINPKYDQAFQFDGGIAMVFINNNMCYIDKKGKLVWDPEDVNHSKKAMEESERIREISAINFLDKSFQEVKHILGKPDDHGYSGWYGEINYLYYEKDDIFLMSPYYGTPIQGDEMVTAIELGEGSEVLNARVGMTFKEIERVLGPPDDGPYECIKEGNYILGYSLKDVTGFSSGEQIDLSFYAIDPYKPTYKAFIKLIHHDKEDNIGKRDEFEYLTYENTRFGYSIDYPSYFIKGEEPVNNDGLIFTSPDSSAKLTVYGSNNVFFWTIEQAYENVLKEVKNPSYHVLRESWFVVSWAENGKIYYRQTFLGEGSENTFIFEYPKAEAEYYDSMVSHIQASFISRGTEWSH